MPKVTSPEYDDDPLRRLEQHLVEETSRNEDARERLASIGDALMALRVQMLGVDVGADRGLQILDQDSAAPIIDRLADVVDRTDEVIVSMDTGAGHDNAYVRRQRARAVSGQVQRALVHPSALNTDIARPELSSRRGTGQQQRVSDQIDTEFLVLGNELVVTLADWGDPTSDYVFIRHPAMLRCFVSWFEMVWFRSPEIESHAGDVDDALIRMLALGAKDEAIARTLSIGLRTVRRRIATLMDQYGVQTRLQLGSALERDGRLSDFGR